MGSVGAKGDSAGELVIESPMLTPGAVAQALVDVAALHGYTVVAIGPNRYRLARSSRPTWAIVAAVVTSVFACVGLLFLLVKTTESGDALIVEERNRVSLRLVGAFRREFVDALGARIASSSGVTPRAGGDRPSPDSMINGPIIEVPRGQSSVPTRATPFAPPVVSDAAASTKLPGRHTDDVSLDTVVHRPGQAVLALADGAVIPVGAGGVVGRDPTPDARVPEGRLHAIAEPSLSKTHLVFGPSPMGIWLIDHHSTNGTLVMRDGQQFACEPGVRTDVPFGASIVAGGLVLTVRRR